MIGVYSAKISRICVESGLNEDQIGAFSLGRDRRHRGMHAELALR
jgi:hypothetical protein